jgi:hypothetical protein
MRRKVKVQMRDAVPKDVDVDHFRSGRFLESTGRPRDNEPERSGFLSIQIGNVRNVSLGLEVRKASHLALQGRRQTPKTILPYLDSPELWVSLRTAA